MITKSALAASLGCPYPLFRRYLRAFERGNLDFFTSCNKYLTDWQEAYIRSYFAQTPWLLRFPGNVAWQCPPIAEKPAG